MSDTYKKDTHRKGDYMAKNRSKLFRKESMDNLASPEQLKDYLQIPKVSMWVVLIAALAAVGGLLAWGIWGQVITTTHLNGLAEGENVICYVSDPADVRLDMPVKIGRYEGEIIAVSGTAISKETLAVQYSEAVVDQLQIGDLNYKVTIKVDGVMDGIVDGVTEVEVETSRVNPISFILSKGNDV